MNSRFLRSSLLPLLGLVALALSGCPASSDPPVGTDSGPPAVDAPLGVDGGPGDVDSGPSAVDGGPSAADGGPVAVDGGPVAVDGGPVAVDGGPVRSDAGSSAMGCSPPCNDTEYCNLCAASQACVTRPADMGRICTTLYAPVCGCDGRTYSNPCVLASAGIGQLHDGECGVGPTPGT